MPIVVFRLTLSWCLRALLKNTAKLYCDFDKYSQVEIVFDDHSMDDSLTEKKVGSCCKSVENVGRNYRPENAEN